MFARIRKNSGTQKRSVVICHNVRHGGKIHQILVKTYGHSADNLQLNAWIDEARQWITMQGSHWLTQHLSTRKQGPMQREVSVFNLREQSRVNVGIKDIFGTLYDEIGFANLLTSAHQKTLEQVIFARLLEPGSKRRLSELSEKRFDEELPLDRIYRMMDVLIKRSDTVQRKIFEATQTALKDEKISLVLFDVTTLSFESINEDELRAFGFSKDFKFNTTQVTLALATTQEGLPVGYKLFPGNTAEAKTLVESINAWRKLIPIEKVTVIGDRAMMSEANLSLLEATGFSYVVAFPLRKLSKSNQSIVLDTSGYQQVEAEDEISRYRVIDLDGRVLCVSFSSKRAQKDAKDRERMIKKLRSKLEKSKNVKQLINKNGYLKFTEISGQAVAAIDEGKIAEDAKWDGLHGVITNGTSCDLEVYSKYRRLWVIEESFRINKHNLKMRPIYHFTPKRIQAHILICYMVFTLIRHLQFRLQKINQPMSANRIIDAIRDIQASILVDITTDKKYRILSRFNEDASTIYTLFNIPQGLAVEAVT